MTRRDNDDYHGGGSGWRFNWRPDRMRQLHDLGQAFGMTEDVPRLSGGGGTLVEVVIYARTAVPNSSPALLELTVRDPRTGRDGIVRVTDAEIRTAIGDCYSQELVRVPVERITWHANADSN